MLIKFGDHDPQGGVQPLVALVRFRKLHRHRERPEMRVALVSASQPISFGVKPYLGPVVCGDDASRMNGAEVLPRWRENTGPHKDIGAITGIYRPARFPTDQISRNGSIPTPNQFTLSGFRRHHSLPIRLVLEPTFKQGFEQAGLTPPFYRIH